MNASARDALYPATAEKLMEQRLRKGINAGSAWRSEKPLQHDRHSDCKHSSRCSSAPMHDALAWPTRAALPSQSARAADLAEHRAAAKQTPAADAHKLLHAAATSSCLNPRCLEGAVRSAAHEETAANSVHATETAANSVHATELLPAATSHLLILTRKLWASQQLCEEHAAALQASRLRLVCSHVSRVRLRVLCRAWHAWRRLLGDAARREERASRLEAVSLLCTERQARLKAETEVVALRKAVRQAVARLEPT